MDDAGVFSKAFFLWVEPMLRSGFKKALQREEAVLLPQRLQPASTYQRFESCWRAQVGAASNNRKSSLVRALWHLLGHELRIACLLQLVVVFLKLSTLFFVRKLVQNITSGTNQPEGIAFAFALWASNLGVGLITPMASFKLQLALLSLSTCFAQAVLRKGAVLHPELRESNRRGDLVTLALSDCSRLNEMSAVIMQGACAPVLLLAIIMFLLVLLGPITLPALVPISVSCYLVRCVGRNQGRNFRGKIVAQGKRLAVLNEMLQSVRFTKYYTLEDHYEAKMRLVRCEEEHFLLHQKLIYALNLPLAQSVPIAIFMVTLMAYWLTHGRLPEAADTFVIMAAARSMYYPFYFFGGFLAGASMFFAACGRLQSLLLLPEVERIPLMIEPDASGGDSAISIQKQDFSWSLTCNDTPTLKDISLELPRGELWVIVGQIGTGKSSVLSAVLGEIGSANAETKSTLMMSASSRSYVGQEPMVMNASVRENVIFGEEHVDEAAYRAALVAAALGPDLEQLPAGDATEIGEKGITLSGGQKARIALARAVFASKTGSVVLLDDPLAAVDAHVGRHLFEECICKALRGTSRLLVTNQLHFLSHPDVTRVLVLSDGRVAEQGTFNELISDSGSLLSTMAASLGDVKWNAQSDGDMAVPETAEDIDSEPAGKAKDGDAAEARGKNALALFGGRTQADLGGLTQAEHKEEGAISMGTILFFVRNMGGYHLFAMCVTSSWLVHVTEISLDMFLAAWQDNLLSKASEFYLCTWLAIAGSGILVIVASRMLWVVCTLHASNILHSGVLAKVMHCPTAFFDRTPSGRIMNRLGEDQAVVDWLAPLSLEVLLVCWWRVFNIVSLSIFVRPLVALVVVPCIPAFMALREIHRRVTRETLRWWMVTKSPVFHIFEETLSGSSTIYAFGREAVFFKRFEDALCINLQWMLSKEVSNSWAQQRLEILASVVVLSLALLLVLTAGSVSTSVAAASVVFSLSCGESLNFFTAFLVTVEGSFASVERVKEFTEQLEQEPPWRLPADAVEEMQKWPGSDPTLVVEGISVRYLPHMPRALDSLSIHLAAREKLGIVGRTGSGKSTVMGALFRLFPLEQGRVLLGGVDTAQIGIGLLRRQITIVPQDPVLFSGTLRRNLDPLEKCSDSALWDALKRSTLSELVEALPGGLDASVADGGSNFSVGERQVFCLVRALLRGSQVLCLDEATANVDPTNDARIQHILKEDVVNCIVVTIAHRLRTVLSSDRILVLDGGHLAQLDTPQELLSKHGLFRDLAYHAGISLEEVSKSQELDLGTIAAI